MNSFAIPNKNDELCNAWIVASDPHAFTYLSELSALAGLEPRPALLHAGPPPPQPGTENQLQVLGEDGDVLILDAAEPDFPRSLNGLPRVTVLLTEGSRDPLQAHDVVLPGEEGDFLRLLAELAPGDTANTSRVGRVVLVGGWHGGGGSTTAATSLAFTSGSVFLDAAGNRGGWLVEEEGLAWEDLDLEDLPSSQKLVSGLPRSGGIPILGPSTGRTILPDAEVVVAVLSTLKQEVVVDCGANLDALNALARDLEDLGKPVSVVLVGRASVEGVRALGQVWAGGVVAGPVTHLLAGRKDRLFLAVAQRYGLRWRSFPRARSSRWRKIQGELWAA